MWSSVERWASGNMLWPACLPSGGSEFGTGPPSISTPTARYRRGRHFSLSCGRQWNAGPRGTCSGPSLRARPSLASRHTALTCESSGRRVSTAGTHSMRLRPRSGSRSLFGSREGNERCVRAPTCSDDDELLPRARPVGHRVPVSGKRRRATPEFSTGLLVVRIQI